MGVEERSARATDVSEPRRCFGDGDPLFERYHDEEWGFPVIDERGLFERLTLEAFQAGLSWGPSSQGATRSGSPSPDSDPMSLRATALPTSSVCLPIRGSSATAGRSKQ